ncbi:MAG: 50S ribosomal protein L9, partial [Planctomycetota bacterium]
MKILLRKNIENVGKRGEIVEVADGYARNYLFPKNFALKPTPQNVKQLETEKRHHV